MKLFRKTRKAFTLVEIMIVVAIIGILIAIAVPGFLKARETSRTKSGQENMTKIDSAVQQYILENNAPNFTAVVGTRYLGSTAIASWGPLLVGNSSYIRYTPICPSSGTYYLDDGDEAPAPAYCTTGGTHVFETGS